MVFDKSPNDYDQYLGDISGQDVLVHHAEPEILIREIRNWLSRLYPHKGYPGSNSIWSSFLQFNIQLPKELKDSWSANELHSMQMSEYRHYAENGF
jgi:hypothetical protein